MFSKISFIRFCEGNVGVFLTHRYFSFLQVAKGLERFDEFRTEVFFVSVWG